MKFFFSLWLLGLGMMMATLTQAQDPGLDNELDLKGALQEEAVSELSTQSLLLDNTRSKVGRDFFETFYRTYNQAQAPGAAPVMLPDTTAGQAMSKPLELELDVFLITIDELPASSGMGSIISVSVNDELLFQQFVQNRLDVIEELAMLVAQSIKEYVINYDATQRQLINEDGQGTGIY